MSPPIRQCFTCGRILTNGKYWSVIICLQKVANNKRKKLYVVEMNEEGSSVAKRVLRKLLSQDVTWQKARNAVHFASMNNVREQF